MNECRGGLLLIFKIGLRALSERYRNERLPRYTPSWRLVLYSHSQSAKSSLAEVWILVRK